MINDSSDKKMFVLLPAYNEAGNISTLLEKWYEVIPLINYKVTFVTVDDGSTDNTEEEIIEFANKLNVTNIRHHRNKGLSETLKSGFLSIMQNASDNDYVICMDADDTHIPSQALLMVDLLDKGDDVVIASRYQPGAKIAGVSNFRKMLSRCASILFQIFLPIKNVKDFSCGFRAYRVKQLRKVIEREGEEIFQKKGFACTIALLLALRREGIKASEIPIDLRYQQKRGVSKMDIKSTSIESIRILISELLRSNKPV